MIKELIGDHPFVSTSLVVWNATHYKNEIIDHKSLAHHQDI